MLIRVVLVALAFGLLVSGGAGAQELCGDLDLDGDVDADDAAILRGELAASSPMALDQALSCDVIDEPREPGLEPDPADLAGRCSMSDSAVMIRSDTDLPPGPAQTCALGSGADCCSAHPGVGCNASNTVECVCAQDPSCCTVDWDGSCAALACGTSCAPTCSPGSAYCAGGCTDVQTDAANCGTCGNTCTNPHGVTSCSSAACAPLCFAGFNSCDGNLANGCEAPLNTLTNCGACLTPCALANASESCATGSCALVSCTNGFCNEDGLVGTGCERDLSVAAPCAGAPILGSVSGDTGAGILSTSGVGASWLRVLVTEDDSGLTSVDLGARIRLTPGAGQNYDLEAYCDSCAVVVASSSNGPGEVDEVYVRWQDKAVIPGTDSGRTVYLHVVYAAAADCTHWSLSVAGNIKVGPYTCGSK